ncbi:MAG: DinB family protein [Mucilaginibacter sp.]|uniref:DinB family protein n=1 Tax=Mucilaginibacter sp. TaxID=1882438 RepID=UPI003266723E
MDIKANLTEADQTFTSLLQVLSTISQQNINKIPFAGSWTAGQDVQHIILSAGGSVQLLNGPIKDTDRDFEENVAKLRAMFLNFDTKFQSPESIRPEEKDYDKQELIDTLQKIKADYLNAIQTLDPTKTCVMFEFPGSGHITRAEAIAFTNTHTIRHLQQLKNICERLAS